MWDVSRIVHRILITAGVIVVLGDAGIARADDSQALKIDPALRAAAAVAGSQSLPVWVSFTDKGEQSPGDLALALAAAGAQLTPRALARRQRAHVSPLVDERDIPLYPPYLDALRERGFAPYATSRWLNQVAVRMAPARLEEAASLPFVSGLSLVERGMRTPERGLAGAPTTAPGPACADCAVQVHTYDYGLNATAAQQIHVPDVHDAGYTGTGVVIAVLDDGFNYYNRHPAFASLNVPAGFVRDFVDGDINVQDTTGFTCCSHGTLVLGCAAGNLSGSYVGTAPTATYALARTEVDATETPIEMSYWAMAAEWADSLGANIISTSLGYSTFDYGIGNYTPADMNGHTTTISRAAEIAASKGILVVVAAGNEGDNPAWLKIDAPADVNGDSVLSIGAVSSMDIRASFSSIGPTADGRIKPDLVAMGVNNWCTSGTGYITESGTSLSTPLVAGLAACLMQARPTLAPTLIIRSLRETAARAGPPDTLTGYGLPNGLLAMEWQAPLSVGTAPATPLAILLMGPNPHDLCREAARVTFGIGADAPPSAHANVSVFDLSGRRIRNLYDGVLTRGGWMTASWDGNDDAGRAAAAGMYFIGLDSLGRRATVRLVSLR